ncbi:NTP/NDP exchange transporter [Sphaerotilaceae bacterium SBD11-9]
MTTWLLRRTRATPQELAAVLWSFSYFFALLAGYYVLRPIRDEMGLQLGARALQELFTAVFAVMLLLVPAFGWLNRRFARRQLLPWLYGFFMLNLFGFFLVFEAGGTQSPVVARAFFVWVAVYNLFIISVFWSFMADLFDTEQARRLYGFISAGGTLGALTGPLITAGLVKVLGPKVLVLVSAALLGVAIVAIFRLRGLARERGPGADDGEHAGLQGSVWSGLTDVLHSRYLLGICLFLFSYALLSTFLYFQSVELLPQTYTDPAERTQLLAQIDLVVNVLALLLQVLAFKGLITRLGTRVTLVLLPLVSVAGFIALALFPVVGVIVVFGVLRRAGEYALSKPARETLFNVLPPEQKYKAKNVIDTLVHRTGDTASGWIFAGLRGLGLSGVQISWLSVPIAVGWVAIAWSLGRQAETLQAKETSASPTIA